MSSLTLPPEVISLLAQRQEATELRDARGNCIGVFEPRNVDAQERERLRSLFDLEEAERVAATKQGGYSLQEVKEYLRSLEKEG